MTQGQGGVPPTMMMQGFDPSQQQQPPPPQTPPPYGTPQAPGPQKKKSRWGLWVGGGCGGCLVVMCILCGIGGYVGYLEEGVPYDDPGEEIASIPIASGVPFSTNVTWDGRGYGDIRAYVDLGTGVTSGERITGTFGCQSDYGGGSGDRAVDVYYYSSYDGTPPDGWVSLQNYDYRRGSPDPFTCGGTLTLPPGASSPRLVITVKQRPSDWMNL